MKKHACTRKRALYQYRDTHSRAAMKEHKENRCSTSHPSIIQYISYQSLPRVAKTHVLSSLSIPFGLILIPCNKDSHLGGSTGQLRVEEQGAGGADEPRVGGRLPRRQHAALDGAAQQVSCQEVPRLVPHHLFF